MFLLRALCKSPATIRFSSKLLHSFAVESNMKFVVANISHILSCSEQTALSVYQKYPSLRSETALSRIERNIDLLTENGVSKECVGTNPFLLNLTIGALQRKLDTIKRMQPRHIDDFVPLLNMTESILREVAVITVNEYDEIPERSRIYYLSRELQITPETVSKYCSKFEPIFFASFAGISKKLNILLDYGVNGLQILQSLYIFRCSDRRIISRLEDLFANGLHDIELWFFKCTDEKFRKVLASERKDAKTFPIELAHKLKKRNLEKLTILNELNVMLSCDDKTSAHIYYDHIYNIEQLALAKENIQLLTDNGVSLELIQSNSVVLTLPNAKICDNIKLIKDMNPKSIEDFLPLVEVDTAKLKVFSCNAIVNGQSEPSEVHPIYFFSEKLKISPTTVSTYFAKHPDVFFGDSVALRTKLDQLVSHNVQPISVLKSADTFKLTSQTLRSKLMDLKSQGIENISSWMLVCDKSKMEASGARQVEEKREFGEAANTVEYLTKRLNWNDATRDKALTHYPPLAKCGVLRVKAHLDYLLNETHFTAEDINSNASVFRTKLHELKLRMNELARIGLVPRKLYSICLDRQRYLKMVGKFCEKKNCPLTFEAFKRIEERIKE